MFCTYEYFSETTKSILILCKMHVKTSAYTRAGFENKEILEFRAVITFNIANKSPQSHLENSW